MSHSINTGSVGMELSYERRALPPCCRAGALSARTRLNHDPARWFPSAHLAEHDSSYHRRQPLFLGLGCSDKRQTRGWSQRKAPGLEYRDARPARGRPGPGAVRDGASTWGGHAPARPFHPAPFMPTSADLQRFPHFPPGGQFCQVVGNLGCRIARTQRLLCNYTIWIVQTPLSLNEATIPP